MDTILIIIYASYMLAIFPPLGSVYDALDYDVRWQAAMAYVGAFDGPLWMVARIYSDLMFASWNLFSELVMYQARNFHVSERFYCERHKTLCLMKCEKYSWKYVHAEVYIPINGKRKHSFCSSVNPTKFFRFHVLPKLDGMQCNEELSPLEIVFE